MDPLYVSHLHRGRHDELVAAAEAWRLSHQGPRPRFRHRAGARLVAVGTKLMGSRNPQEAR